MLYIPDEDISAAALRPSQKRTHCPFKGDAAYWSVHAGGKTAVDAVWAYPDPKATAGWLRGYKAIGWGAMDGWYDEDEKVEGHLRDPYHRVDVRATSQRVRVLAAEQLLAESTRAKVLSETGLPNRYYFPVRTSGSSCSRATSRRCAPTRGGPPTGRPRPWPMSPGPTRNPWRTRSR